MCAGPYSWSPGLLRDSSSIPLHFVFETGSLGSLELAQFCESHWPESAKDPPVSTRPALRLHTSTEAPSFLRGFWGLLSRQVRLVWGHKDARRSGAWKTFL